MQVDLNSMNNFGVTKEEILLSLKYVDLFAPCRSGLYQLCGTEDLDECREFLLPYFNNTLLVTLGEKGSVASIGKQTPIYQEIVPGNVVDTTGAGDSYMGAMLYFYLMKQLSLKKSMILSSYCASITCSTLGARSSPTINELRTHSNDTVRNIIQ